MQAEFRVVPLLSLFAVSPVAQQTSQQGCCMFTRNPLIHVELLHCWWGTASSSLQTWGAEAEKVMDASSTFILVSSRSAVSGGPSVPRLLHDKGLSLQQGDACLAGIPGSCRSITCSS